MLTKIKWISLSINTDSLWQKSFSKFHILEGIGFGIYSASLISKQLERDAEC